MAQIVAGPYIVARLESPHRRESAAAQAPPEMAAHAHG
jgi:hypothetical protein